MSSIPRLRPMSIIDMLDAAFRLYRQHFLTFIGIVALLQVPMAILQFLVQLPYLQASPSFLTPPPTPAPGANPFDNIPFTQPLIYYALLLGLSAVQYLLVYNLMTGALANAISRSYMNQPISIFSAYNLGLKRIIALIAASLLPFAISLIFVALIVGFGFGAFSALGTRNGEPPNFGLVIGAIFGMIGLIFVGGIVGLFFYVRLLLTTQAIVLEGQGPWAGLVRSWRLVGQAFWRSLGIFLLVYAVMYVVSLIVQIPLVALGAVFGMMFNNAALFQGISSLVTYAVLILVLPLQFIIFTLLYYDLRIRKEGYDLELMAQTQQAVN